MKDKIIIHETDINTLPSKTFYQGTIGDEEYEQPVIITYFNDVIELEQYPHGKVLILPSAFEALVKSIRKDKKK